MAVEVAGRLGKRLFMAIKVNELQVYADAIADRACPDLPDRK